MPQTLLTTGSNAGLGFSSYSLPSTYHENQYLVNGDYLVTPKHTLAARVYLATIDQYRTFGSPQGYPGTPMVPGQGTPQALAAHDYVASLNLTSAFRKTLVNEARMSFTRSTQSAHGDGTPSATSLGMTPADRFFDQPPEMTILGPLGSFRALRHAGQRFRHREQILLVDRQSRLGARQPQDARRRLLPDAEQLAATTPGWRAADWSSRPSTIFCWGSAPTAI